MLTDRGRKLLQFSFVKTAAWVPGITHNMLDRNEPVRADLRRGLPAGHRNGLIHLTDEGGKATPKTSLGLIFFHGGLFHLRYNYAARR